jgi:hypothetical protein
MSATKKVFEIAKDLLVVFDYENGIRTVRYDQEIVIPEGYKIVYEGFAEEGDILWDKRTGHWDAYEGNSDCCDAIDDYVLVVRKGGDNE